MDEEEYLAMESAGAGFNKIVDVLGDTVFSEDFDLYEKGDDDYYRA